MIQLIATDLDGTLLDDNKQIHPEYWDIFDLLTQKGVLFMAASGRQYYKLLKQFKRVENRIMFLAENGTFVKYKGEEVFVNELPLSDAHTFIEKGRTVPAAELILCGKNAAYVESDHESFLTEASQYYERLQRVDDIMKIKDTILKVTMWDHINSETNAYPHFKEYEKDFKVAVAGDVWLDITNKTASKGTAIERIQKLFNISYDDTLIFGDYLNDLDMMKSGYHSYAMKNAHPKIKELARFETQHDNNNNGVVATIKELFEL